MSTSKKISFFPILMLVLFSTCTSAPTTPVPIESSESWYTNEQISVLPSLDSEEKEGQSYAESEYWSVEDVDISEIDTNRKLIAFTFDDAPSRTFESILAVFATFNENNEDCKASATMFFNGHLFNDETPHLLYTALTLGFELGNHSHSHYDLTTLDKQTLTAEIEKTDALLEKIDKKKHHLFRAPFGKINELVKACAKTPIIDWTIDTLDWTETSEQAIYDSVFSSRFSGAIVLMHDGYEGTVSALKRLLPDLKADGYQVVSVSKMIKAHGCHFRKGNVYIRARKQN